MFRPVRRKNREISIEAAKDLLRTSRRGVLAVNGDNGYPYALPINYTYDEASNIIIFHGARAGHKLDSIKACDKVCFTVYGNETIKEEAWAPYVQSTIVYGRCHLVDDQERAMDILRDLAKKYYPSEDIIDEEIAKAGKAVQMFQIEIEYISGKEIQEK
ncbi:5-nitroimidazole antibiotic resistance protein NimB [Peptostreptococcus stomatis DSM 17678]|uniref:5-nitroimidazole antibiotic resistance protein NimB n=1 Tax=Peptostreptococcus stomatis DSM 17678 TaxID=596315 RepID=E0E4R6_9FIRM|nr:pyridoxamine 5'-phosphate oxidase family protein [Peptostreptococcus stomatis]EFM64135.1 5-nitroimidazole antibiotic resistance protein NimB [Peptostreptococcus stomatis DSM 17678]